jgi:hypothetical protein
MHAMIFLTSSILLPCLLQYVLAEFGERLLVYILFTHGHANPLIDKFCTIGDTSKHFTIVRLIVHLVVYLLNDVLVPPILFLQVQFIF